MSYQSINKHFIWLLSIILVSTKIIYEKKKKIVNLHKTTFSKNKI